jgi:hypothetical protein
MHAKRGELNQANWFELPNDFLGGEGVMRVLSRNVNILRENIENTEGT